ncbi:heme NO-binding domain-containing protein [Nevskia sp.]|uniref:heme NO-binding domain-containing protein n=1 Tax=Nevskia sp. TaxID=1929292 RepID=UPI0025D5D76A|nr:heme NO-binding domain-containing protein [Nevskia sp.]
MKGMMFTEFLDMVEARHGLAVKDRIIREAALPNDGAYTSVGSYPHQELLRLAGALSNATGVPTSDLMLEFADTVFALFLRRYKPMIEAATSCFAFLEGIEHHIHVEVRKLYPDAEFPSFDYPSRVADVLVMDYRSPRPMAKFAEGLVLAAIRHYGEPITMRVEDRSDGAGTAARFTLTRQPA